MVLLVLGFLAIWVVLQEFGTVLIWLLAAFLVVKALRYSARAKATRYYWEAPDEPTAKWEPVTPELSKPLDSDFPQW